MTHRLGFDVDKLEEFNKYASQNPNDVVLGLQAKTIWEGSGGGSLGKIGPWALAGQVISKPTRDFSIQFGAWKEVLEQIGVEGAIDQIEPVEAALVAMASCVNTAIAINAAREDVEFEGLEITARADVDPRVLLGVVSEDEASSCLQSVDLQIEVQGDVSEVDKERIKNMARRSPVHAMITHPNNVTTTVA